MASDDGADAEQRPRPPPTLSAPRRDHGPFVLRPLLEGVPLSGDGSNRKIKINCVDFYDGNLYVGTSASELLHFVQIPPDPADHASRPSFILASRLRPAHAALPEQAPLPGVQQALLLSRAGKACVLCNWTVTFYSLPELSPVFGTLQVKNCSWIGGVDHNDTNDGGTGQTILLSLSKKLRAVRIGEDARVLRTTDFAGSVQSVRRESIVCVADPRGYALLDIERQLKIPLMGVSSLDESSAPGEMGQVQSIAPSNGDGLQRSTSAAQSRPSSLIAPFQAHSRHSSLTGFVSSGSPARREPRASEPDVGSLSSPSPPPSQNPRPPRPPSAEDAIRPPRSAAGTPAPQDGPQPPPLLNPHIASPTPDEFLLVTGTKPKEPGIGIFVNLDGDPTRPTLEFSTYPLAIAVEGGPADVAVPCPSEEEDGYVLASLEKVVGDTTQRGLEIQRWSSTADAKPTRFWLQSPEFGDKGPPNPYGVRSVVGVETTQFQEIADKLCRSKFSPFSGVMAASTPSLRSLDSRTAASIERVSRERELFDRDTDSVDEEPLPDGWEATRAAEEYEFARRLAGAGAKVVVWAEDRLWWAIRNPLLLQLESVLDGGGPSGDQEHAVHVDRQAIFSMLASIRGRDAKTELDFMTFNFLRQRAGILLLINFLDTAADSPFTAGELQVFEEILVDSELDPRVVVSLIPALRNETVIGRKGIWIFAGVKATVESQLRGGELETRSQAVGGLGPLVLSFIRRFLLVWRRKKGFGSVDDSDVFRTVDAALLLVLLELDRSAPSQPGKASPARQDLYELADKGVDCFERAVSLLESHRRLYVLSRLYQSRKMATDVLATWRRIIQGERDDGGEFRDGEGRVREYLSKVSSQAVVQEYGIWLANRNPKLGVQVFADETNRAPKFEAGQVVALLREEAPDAVKYYLEHLVFGKGHLDYVNDLMAHYLAIVIGDIESSEESRESYKISYEAYRALDAPKPTFHHFLAANAPPDSEVWQGRLRLLQLLGGAHSYDAAAILARIACVAGELLVPEMIILAGREGRHEDALRLLVHRLGDYDTAVWYCVRGGSTIYGAVVPRLRGPAASGRPAASAPTRRRLFRALLGEFLAMADPAEREAQAGMLLERFGGWFGIEEVLGLVPDDWRVEALGGFLVGALRRLVSERRGVEMARALRQAENVRVGFEWVCRVDEEGGVVEFGDSGVDLNEG